MSTSELSPPEPRRTGHITLRNLSKRFAAGAAPAVDNINLDIASGEFMTLLGPSGSGKTTTLNMIAGFIRPTSGRVELDGRDVSRLPPHRRGLGMVFQHYALFPHLSVAENVAFPLRRRRVPAPEIRRRVADVLALVGLTGYEHRRPNALSGGQQQRVLIARALAAEPDLLVLDEPTAGVDATSQDAFADALRAFTADGGTVLLVAHELGPLQPLVTRAVVIHSGRIAHDGAVPEPTGYHALPGHDHVHPHARSDRTGIWGPSWDQ